MDAAHYFCDSVEDCDYALAPLKFLRSNATPELPKILPPLPVVTNNNNDTRKYDDQRKESASVRKKSLLESSEKTVLRKSVTAKKRMEPICLNLINTYNMVIVCQMVKQKYFIQRIMF